MSGDGATRASVIARPEQRAAHLGIESTGHAAPIVITAGGVIEHLACSGIVQVPSVRALFVNLEEFQSRTVRAVVGQMDGIAMAEACGIEQTAVVVEGGRAPDNLVAAIAVHIGYRHVVVAVAIHSGTAAASGGCFYVGIGRLRAVAAGIVGGQLVARFRFMTAQPALV